MDIDVDNELDGELLSQLRSLGTTDRDVLIAEFQAVLGNALNAESCAFFLDMNNWNLQNAVCSYYDLEQPVTSLPSMKLLADVTVGNGEAVAPYSNFVKTWRIKNAGIERWPPGCQLRHCSGDNLSTVERRMVCALDPGESTEVGVEMRSPGAPGTYTCVWRMATPAGTQFGDVLQWSVTVAEGGTLGITQQLARLNGGSGAESMMMTGTQQTAGMDVQQQQQQQQQQQVVLYSVQPFSNAMMNPPAQPIEEDTEMS